MSFCPSANSENQTVALQWNGAALQGIRDAKLGTPAVARALAIVHTCVYDAWTAYDERGVVTQLPLEWETFTDAANEAGLSHHYGGIHCRGRDDHR
jgi:hypothetical protein